MANPIPFREPSQSCHAYSRNRLQVSSRPTTASGFAAAVVSASLFSPHLHHTPAAQGQLQDPHCSSRDLITRSLLLCWTSLRRPSHSHGALQRPRRLFISMAHRAAATATTTTSHFYYQQRVTAAPVCAPLIKHQRHYSDSSLQRQHSGSSTAHPAWFNPTDRKSTR